MNFDDYYSQSAIAEVSKLVEKWKTNTNYELEARHVYITDNKTMKFLTGTPEENTYHILEKMILMNDTKEIDPITTIDTNYEISNIRQSMNVQNRGISYISKKKIQKIDLNYWKDGFHHSNIRISLAIEEKIPIEAIEKIKNKLNSQNALKRRKERKTVEHKNRFRYELTKITSYTHNKNSNNNYEFEIELIHGNEFHNQKSPELVAKYLLFAMAETFQAPLIRRIFCISKDSYIDRPTVKLGFKYPPRDGIIELMCQNEKGTTIAKKQKVCDEEIHWIEEWNKNNPGKFIIANCYYNISTGVWQIRKIDKTKRPRMDSAMSVFKYMECRVGK